MEIQAIGIMMDEFGIIDHFFAKQILTRSDVALGIGDDCAILNIPPGKQLAVSMDTLNEGIHFFSDVDPQSLGHKALAVNLSDLAAMGAVPAWCTLAISFPEANQDWLQNFVKGFFALAGQYGIQLVGGDTTRGPLSITCTVYGFVEPDYYLQRSGAAVGDKIYVTGTLGDAGLALAFLKGDAILLEQDREAVLQKLYYPNPRIHEGIFLSTVANSAIDISDGLIADLQHILDASQVGADLWVNNLPLSAQILTQRDSVTVRKYALSAGDDYELCFTVPLEKEALLLANKMLFSCGLTCIGVIREGKGLALYDEQGRLDVKETGYIHWR